MAACQKRQIQRQPQTARGNVLTPFKNTRLAEKSPLCMSYLSPLSSYPRATEQRGHRQVKKCLHCELAI